MGDEGGDGAPHGTSPRTLLLLLHGRGTVVRLGKEPAAGLQGLKSLFYDPVGHLTNLTYPVSSAIHLQYDALNRLTTMVDSVGTTRYAYDAAEALLSEDGPWSSDTVSYTSQNRLRGRFSLAQPNGTLWPLRLCLPEPQRGGLVRL